MNFIFYCDYPPAGHDYYDARKPVVGWVSSDVRIDRMELAADGVVDRRVRLVPRTDVEKANRKRFRHHTGFESSVTVAEWLKGRDSLAVLLRLFSGEKAVGDIPLTLVSALARKQRKRDRLGPVLACPQCHAALVRLSDAFRCEPCGQTYSTTGNSVDFLTEEFKKTFSIAPTENVSAWGYDPKILDIIRRNPEGLFLDCGAGFRNQHYDNVINYEIVDYPSTDVLGVGERLPFADDSLDGVFSVAVLEHVKSPKDCAAEIERVLKPGGVLFCAAAFLQPVHAYPHHYFNMTSLGLESLFPNLEIKEREVPLSLHPMKAVTWLLQGYANGLSEPLKSRFLKMPVSELLALGGPERWHELPLVRDLAREKWFELANGTTILAVKK
ncbi:MAG: methyltransferase domain-containing protein [Lentisphaerae bacterium]|nr:methyltransferase domain-containing protein [Lentisphaerota bacterium]